MTKTFQVYTPWNSITVDAVDEKQAKINALKQLLFEVENYGINLVDVEEVEDTNNWPNKLAKTDKVAIL